MISLDVVNGGGQASRGEQQAGESRRAAWMLEMERALLAANKLGGDGGPATLPSGVAPAASRWSAVNPQRERQHGSSDDASTPAQQALAAAAIPEAASRSTAPETSVAADRTLQAGALPAVGVAANPPSVPAAQVATTTPSAQPSPPQAVSAEPDGNAAAAVHSVNLTSASLQNPALPDLPPSAQMARYAMTGSNLAALQAGPVRLNQSMAAMPSVQGLNQVAVSGRAALPFAAWSLPDAAKFARAEESDSSAGAAQAQADLPQTEAFAERQLHLYQGTDGVQAWIRDAELSQLQAQSVAQALSNELGLSGLKLKSLTLNGRRLERTGAPENAGADIGGEALAAAPDIGPAASAGQN